MTLKFYIGAMSIELGGSKVLGGIGFKIVFRVYGKRYYDFKRKVRKTKKKKKALRKLSGKIN